MTSAPATHRQGYEWILGAALLLAPVFILVTCYFAETPTSRYPSYQAAREAGALDEGKWIPPFLPESARNIVETHNIDTNALRISFDYTPGDLGRIPQECRRMGEPKASIARYECLGWGLPIEIQLELSGKGLVVSRHDT